ncbi:hypothetical protein [Hymenobacter negativus]|uniref:Uncharacterized protein n=1 Tax=Hymenobacter negativus TaxID=2795026 RepID=A0ABS3QIY9_9BACT|nr:hypothetical protein [Hymenobacter negativus]MBO2010983.1 hypothetical protein [Hymenobacter negativus]
MTNNFPSGIISQDVFNEYAANWLTVVGNNAELNQGFQTDSGKLLSVSFTMEQIQQLVSVVGAHYIMAKFLITSDGLKFTLALYAADAERNRLSSYYGAGNLSQVPGLPGAEVPDVLAEKWLECWSNDQPVTSDMFTSSMPDAPLQGYAFDVNDFLALFYDLPKIDGEILLVHFGLHEYYRGTAEGDKLTQTFGLVLRVSGQQGSSDPFYDMSAPCPPLC